ncbi:MAG: 16S rRNA (cytosine(1402)-N(4))-methyltransferase RsmH [Treponema sp.]|nr:16S rRNA (cytosine(1402)-N(4))-methyltransferase RsmH [Treponema sp.]
MIEKKEGDTAVHVPVLLNETLQYLEAPPEGGLMVDATLGEGGHSEAFLSRFPSLRIIGIDADKEILARASRRLAKYGGRISFYSGWSGDFFAGWISRGFSEGESRPDTVLFDLGISMFHYEESGRGFSFRKDQYLDMRIDPSRGRSAAELIASLSEGDLADLLYRNGGERFSRSIARSVADAKRRGTVSTTGALAELIKASVPAKYRYGALHPATRTFQALRIAVNGELEQLPGTLEKALAVLKVGGRMGVISFHSGEDRLVKGFFKGRSAGESSPSNTPIGRSGGMVKILTRKALCSGKEERRTNPPSRSAKFRAAEKVCEGQLK